MQWKNKTIEEQGKSLQRLEGENLKLNSQLAKLSEEAGARDTEIAQLKVALEVSIKSNEMLKGEVASVRRELEQVGATLVRDRVEYYAEGYLDYLRTFFAADPGYDWSVHFPPSAPEFMATFQEDNVDTIREAREALDSQFKEEAEKAAVAARGEGKKVDGAPLSQPTGP